MANGELARAVNPSIRSIIPFDIDELESQALITLYLETASHIKNIRIERVPNRKRHPYQVEQPAMTLGIAVRRPTIRFSDWLDREQRIDAIGHELLHILLVYRYGLRMVDWEIPLLASNQDIFDYYFDLNRHWKYLLEQIVNTIHHQILIGCLKEEYGIESDLQLTLLRHNYLIVSRSYYPDRESQYAEGLIAFEYEKRMGRVDRELNFDCRSDFFWKAYHSAQKVFGAYTFRTIPSPAGYEEDVLGFLEGLGYQRDHFMFLPKIPSDFPSATDSGKSLKALPCDMKESS